MRQVVHLGMAVLFQPVLERRGEPLQQAAARTLEPPQPVQPAQPAATVALESVPAGVAVRHEPPHPVPSTLQAPARAAPAAANPGATG
ncbi:MAG: multifunctional 2',3'-cyclic-nucleotide 2'-phosphodiesterase/5'-nucleotidase/3'-nucleotidase, partial [Actinomycetota bacterium]